MNLKNIKQLLLLIAYSTLLKGVEVLGYFLVFRALGIRVPPQALLTYIPLTMLIAEIPITFMGLGTREAALVYFLGSYAPASSLLAAGVLVSFTEYVLPNVVSLAWTRQFLNKLATNTNIHEKQR